MKIIPIVAAVAILSACASDGSQVQPVVSGFNGSSVSIQQAAMWRSDPLPQTTAEAASVCARVGKQAEYASMRMVGEFTGEFLYLCV